MTNRTHQAKIITRKDLENLRYPLPQSWKKAAGLLKNRKVSPLKYQKQVRKEWEERFSKLEK